MDFLQKIEDENLRSEIENYINNLENQYKIEINNLKNSLTTVKTDLESKNKELFKIKTLLGLDENTPLNEELIKSKLNNNEDLSKVENKYNELIKELNEKFENKIKEYEDKIKSFENEKKSLLLENKIKEVIPNIKAQDGALEDILFNLKNSADIDDNGNIIYKDSQGVLRNEKGLPMSIYDKLKELKEKKPYLFKSEIKEGSGNANNINSNQNISNQITSDFQAKMLAKAKMLGINLN
jgi:hypothetical protein